MLSERQARDEAHAVLYGPRYRFVQQAAMRSVARLAGDLHEDRRPFYSDVEIALRCDAKIRAVSFPIPGDVIPRLEGGYWIRTNKNDSRERQRFTVCHEVGHILFQTSALFPEQFSHPLQQRYDAIIEESVCDKIATSLLMPADAYRREALALPVTLDSVSELAEVFWVTRDAALVRLLELRPWRCAWVQWRIGRDGDALEPTWWSPRHTLDTPVDRLTVLRCLHAVVDSVQVAYHSGRVARHRLTDDWTVESTRVEWRRQRSVISMLHHAERLAPWMPTG